MHVEDAMTVSEPPRQPSGEVPLKEGLQSTLPDQVDASFVRELHRVLLECTHNLPGEFTDRVSSTLVEDILTRLEHLLKQEPTLVKVSPTEGCTVTVVGDTHGQYHDVSHMLSLAGDPSPKNLYVFNGDYVDRGAWGLETWLLLAAWKLALPRYVTLLRGNHETALCSMVYGFKGELVAKFGRRHWKRIYSLCKRAFAALPLAAHIAERTLVLHGGLFRKPRARARLSKPKRKRSLDLEVGDLGDLAASSKGGLDPSGAGASVVATDVLWSDPVAAPGFHVNTSRGVGMVFGPDVTRAFLERNALSLVLRSHEGPDAREGRDDAAPMDAGYTLDHVSAAGMLATVFSAPDYPQFQHAGTARNANRAAVARLTGPLFDAPSWLQYDATLPRPAATPFYDLGIPDSDEEMEPLASDLSGMTDVRGAVECSPDEAAEDEAESVPQGGTPLDPTAPTLGVATHVVD